MTSLKVRGLTGLILSSAQPERLAKFYQEVLGIPLALNQHGNMPQHWECDYNGIHFAVLKGKVTHPTTEPIVPSFAVDDIESFVTTHDIKLTHPMMDLGGGAYIASFKDPDGNTLRCWMNKQQ